jgi:uncharacterized membrane protein
MDIMATYCVKCGASLGEGVAFCAACGTPVSAAAPTTAAAPAGSQSTGMTSNVAAALAYLVGFITGIIFLAIEPYNKDPFVRFHAFQSIFLNVAFVVVWIGFSIIASIFRLVSVVFAPLIWLGFTVVWLGFVVLWIVMIVKAYQNQKMVLPIIGPLAQQQAGS